MKHYGEETSDDTFMASQTNTIAALRADLAAAKDAAATFMVAHDSIVSDLRNKLSAAKASIPTGWSVRTNCDVAQRWIVITGPRGQSAAFEVDIGSVRAEVLRDLARDFDAAIAGSKI